MYVKVGSVWRMKMLVLLAIIPAAVLAYRPLQPQVLYN